MAADEVSVRVRLRDRAKFKADIKDTANDIEGLGDKSRKSGKGAEAASQSYQGFAKTIRSIFFPVKTATTAFAGANHLMNLMKISAVGAAIGMTLLSLAAKVAAATFAVLTLGALGLVAGIGGLGIVFAAQSQAVKSAWGDLGTSLAIRLRNIAGTLEPVIIHLADVIDKLFDAIIPVLDAAFKALTPLLTRTMDAIAAVVRSLLPMVMPLTRAVIPVFDALNHALVRLSRIVASAFIKLAPSIQRFGAAVAIAVDVVADLFNGLVSLAVVGAPLLAGLLTGIGWLLNRVIVPAIEAMAKGWIYVSQVTNAVVARISSLWHRFSAEIIGRATAVATSVRSSLGLSLVWLSAKVRQLLPVIAAFARTVGRWFVGTLIPALQSFGRAVVYILQPAFPMIVKGFNAVRANFVPVAQAIGRWIMGTIVPALQSFGRSVRAILPRVVEFAHSMVVWFVHVLLPALVKLVAYLGRTFAPSFRALGKAISKDILPALRGFVVRLREVMPTILRVAKVVAILIVVLLYIGTKVLGKVLPVAIRLVGLQFRFMLAVIGVAWGVLARLVRLILVFSGAVKVAATGILKFATAIGKPIVSAIKGVLEVGGKLVTFFDKLPGVVTRSGKAAWEGLVSGFKAAVNFLIDAWNGIDFGIHINIPSWVPEVGGKGFNVDDIIPDIPRLWSGGTMPFGGEAIVGEMGPERISVPPMASVVPLTKTADAGSGSGHAPTTVQVMLDRKVLAEAVIDYGNTKKARR